MNDRKCPFCETMIPGNVLCCPNCHRTISENAGSEKRSSGPAPPAAVPPPPSFRAAPGPQRSTTFTWRKATPYVVLSFVALLLFLLLLLSLRGGGRGGSGGELAGREGGVGTDVGPGSGDTGGGTGAGGGGASPPQDPAPGAQGEEAPTDAPPPAEGGTGDDVDSNERPALVFRERKSPVTPADGAAGDGPDGGRGGGGRPLGTGDVSFRIYWTPRSHDIDLHVVDPNGHHLWYKAPGCPCNGILDRDDRTGGGPENIFWPEGKAPRGRYTYYAFYFEGTGRKTVVLQVRKKGEIVEKQTVVLETQGETSAKFTYKH